MRKLFILLLLALPCHGQMLQAIVGGSPAAAGGFAVQATDGHNETAAGAIATLASTGVTTTTGWNGLACVAVVGGVVDNTTSTSGFTDGANTWTNITATLGTGTVPTGCAVAFNVTGAVGRIVTAHFSTTGNFASLSIVYWTGGTTVDTSNRDTFGAVSTYTSSTFSTSTANTIIWYYARANAAPTFTAGLIGGSASTLYQNTDDSALEYRIVSSTQSSITAAIGTGVTASGATSVVVIK